MLDPARDKARHRRDIRDRATPPEQPDHLKVPRRGRILGRPEPRFQIVHAQMISNPRHGSPPRLMAHQPTRCSTTQESSIRVHRPEPVSQVRTTRTVRRTRRQRTLDALGYVALVLLVALITHKHLNQASRDPQPQIVTSVRVEGASDKPAAHR